MREPVKDKTRGTAAYRMEAVPGQRSSLAIHGIVMAIGCVRPRDTVINSGGTIQRYWHILA